MKEGMGHRGGLGTYSGKHTVQARNQLQPGPHGELCSADCTVGIGPTLKRRGQPFVPPCQPVFGCRLWGLVVKGRTYSSRSSRRPEPLRGQTYSHGTVGRLPAEGGLDRVPSTSQSPPLGAGEIRRQKGASPADLYGLSGQVGLIYKPSEVQIRDLPSSPPGGHAKAQVQPFHY